MGGKPRTHSSHKDDHEEKRARAALAALATHLRPLLEQATRMQAELGELRAELDRRMQAQQSSAADTDGAPQGSPSKPHETSTARNAPAAPLSTRTRRTPRPTRNR